MLKGSDLVRALHKLGFFEHRQRGTSHLILKHEDGRRAVVPIHSGSDIPRGTLAGILRDIRVTVEELERVL